LDFSCALFSPDGGLVANAPHIPVHLGAMQEAVRFQVFRNIKLLVGAARISKKSGDFQMEYLNCDFQPGDVLVCPGVKPCLINSE
jgi:hypothetical protein